MLRIWLVSYSDGGNKGPRALSKELFFQLQGHRQALYPPQQGCRQPSSLSFVSSFLTVPGESNSTTLSEALSNSITENFVTQRRRESGSRTEPMNSCLLSSRFYASMIRISTRRTRPTGPMHSRS